MYVWCVCMCVLMPAVTYRKARGLNVSRSPADCGPAGGDRCARISDSAAVIMQQLLRPLHSLVVVWLVGLEGYSLSFQQVGFKPVWLLVLVEGWIHTVCSFGAWKGGPAYYVTQRRVPPSTKHPCVHCSTLHSSWF